MPEPDDKGSYVCTKSKTPIKKPESNDEEAWSRQSHIRPVGPVLTVYDTKIEFLKCY